MALVLVEEFAYRREVELGGGQQLSVGDDPPHPTRLLGEALQRRLGIVRVRRRLQTGDRKRPGAHPPTTCENAFVTCSPWLPPSTGSKVQFLV